MSPIPVVAAVITNENNEILIARRAAHKSQAGKWEFPGGKVEKGEDHKTALQRELKEEFSIEVEIREYIGEESFCYPECSINLIAYRSKKISGDFNLTDHDTIEWILPSNLINYNLAEADIWLIEKLS